MSKLLQGTLPFSQGETVLSETYNKSVRLLELSLGAVDADATPQFTSARRDELNFKAGSIIWNTTEGVRLGVGFRIGGTRLDIRPNGKR